MNEVWNNCPICNTQLKYEYDMLCCIAGDFPHYYINEDYYGDILSENYVLDSFQIRYNRDGTVVYNNDYYVLFRSKDLIEFNKLKTKIKRLILIS